MIDLTSLMDTRTQRNAEVMKPVTHTLTPTPEVKHETTPTITPTIKPTIKPIIKPVEQVQDDKTTETSHIQTKPQLSPKPTISIQPANPVVTSQTQNTTAETDKDSSMEQANPPKQANPQIAPTAEQPTVKPIAEPDKTIEELQEQFRIQNSNMNTLLESVVGLEVTVESLLDKLQQAELEIEQIKKEEPHD